MNGWGILTNAEYIRLLPQNPEDQYDDEAQFQANLLRATELSAIQAPKELSPKLSERSLSIIEESEIYSGGFGNCGLCDNPGSLGCSNPLCPCEYCIDCTKGWFHKVKNTCPSCRTPMIELSDIELTLKKSPNIPEIKHYLSYILSDKNKFKPLNKNSASFDKIKTMIPRIDEILSFCGFVPVPDKPNYIYVNPEKVCNVEIFTCLIAAL
jgi:hypothetical protein